MKYLFNHLKHIRSTLKDKKILLCMDFDGTLSPIAKTPGLAKIPAKTKTIIKRLIKAPSVKIGVVSGRSLSDVKKKVGIKGIYFAGNHGLEIKGPGAKLQVAGKNRRLAIKNIYQSIKKHIKIKGMIIENKRDTLSVHYRLAKKGDIATIKRSVNEITRPYLKAKSIRIHEGKKVIEIRPRINWNKGNALKWLLDFSGKRAYFPIYIGDDKTDEDGFNAIRNRGISVYVGGSSKIFSAKYYVYNTHEVYKLLDLIYIIKTGQDN